MVFLYIFIMVLIICRKRLLAEKDRKLNSKTNQHVVLVYKLIMVFLKKLKKKLCSFFIYLSWSLLFAERDFWQKKTES
jgi:hypothetical protein